MNRRPSARPSSAAWARAAAIAIALEAAALLPATAEAAGQGPPPSDAGLTAHVRGMDQRAATLLDAGRSRSATFRRLCDDLEASNVIVLIETGTAGPTLPAEITFQGTSHTARFLRVTLTGTVPEKEDERLAWLAHELQHAVEIASAPQVVSPATMRHFYRKWGVCTRDAVRVRYAVMWELSLNRR